jgi:hypothetical protein
MANKEAPSLVPNGIDGPKPPLLRRGDPQVLANFLHQQVMDLGMAGHG